MSFDPMAAAIDWLDAYRASDLETILTMYADDAVVECSCCVSETIVDKSRLRAFWIERLNDCRALNLDNIEPVARGTSISYRACDGIVNAILDFDPDGKITFMRWGSPR